MSIPEGEELTLTRAVADAISLHPCQCDGHSADTCPSAIAALAAVRKWDAEHPPQPVPILHDYGNLVWRHCRWFDPHEPTPEDRHAATTCLTCGEVLRVECARPHADGDGDSTSLPQSMLRPVRFDDSPDGDGD